jgi:hypothetical protein
MPDDQRLLLIDSDIFVLLAGAGMLEKVIELLGFEIKDVRRLNALPSQLERGRMTKRYPENVRARARETALKIPVLKEEPADQTMVDRLVQVSDIDGGEGVIYSLVAQNKACLLASADVRAMKALAGGETVRDVKEALKGRIICLEYVIKLLLREVGLSQTATAFVQVRECNTTLRVVFSEGNVTNADQCNASVASYFKFLKGCVGDGYLYDDTPTTTPPMPPKTSDGADPILKEKPAH